LLKKRKRDDEDQRRRIDARTKQKMNQVRAKKEEMKQQTGKNILMPEVFASNRMKQQRNYVHYKRNKLQITRAKKAHEKFASKDQKNTFFASSALHEEQHRVEQDRLILVVRIKGRNDATTP
jgi:hypothetical protein